MPRMDNQFFAVEGQVEADGDVLRLEGAGSRLLEYKGVRPRGTRPSLPRHGNQHESRSHGFSPPSGGHSLRDPE